MIIIHHLLFTISLISLWYLYLLTSVTNICFYYSYIFFVLTSPFVTHISCYSNILLHTSIFFIYIFSYYISLLRESALATHIIFCYPISPCYRSFSSYFAAHYLLLPLVPTFFYPHLSSTIYSIATYISFSFTSFFTYSFLLKSNFLTHITFGNQLLWHNYSHTYFFTYLYGHFLLLSLSYQDIILLTLWSLPSTLTMSLVN